MQVLLGCAVLYMVIVLVMERIREWNVRRAEKQGFTIENNGEEPIIEEFGSDGKSNLTTKNLTKVYDKKVQAVKGIDLSLKQNQILGLLGPNGAGKSSTFNMVTLQTQRTSGDINILGQDIQSITIH